jgi:transcriptional regulator GlxA family with amidase domain
MRLVANIYSEAAATPSSALVFLTALSTGPLLSIVIAQQTASTVITLKVTEPQQHGTAAALRNSIGIGIATLKTVPGCSIDLLRHLEQAKRALLATDGVTAPKSEGLSSAQLKIAKGVLASNLECAITISDVAAACGISRGHLNRGFRQMVGTTPMRWRMDARLDSCRRLLMESELPVSTIAKAAGFTDPCYFSRAFTLASGVSPRAWRRIFRDQPRYIALETPA